MRSYRTVSPLPAGCPAGGLFSVALSVGSRRPGVTWHLALWSPDFPPPRKRGSGYPANSARIIGVFAGRTTFGAEGWSLLSALMPVEQGIRLLGLTLSGLQGEDAEEERQPPLPLAL